MPDYSKTIIYKICCKDLSINDFYIGSTCNFRARKASHKCNCNNETCKGYNYNVYQFIREHGGWDNWDMIMIHEASVENKLQKEKLEREYIDELKPTLNSRTSILLINDLVEKNKKDCKKYHEKHPNYLKEYRESNKEKIAEYNKEKVTCECGALVARNGIARHKKTSKHTKLLQNTL